MTEKNIESVNVGLLKRGWIEVSYDSMLSKIHPQVYMATTL